MGEKAGGELIYIDQLQRINAIGGSPVIDHPQFIPQYPGPLPGAVETGRIVPLARFSPDLVKNIFMVIEEPEIPRQFRVEALAAAPPRFEYQPINP